MSQILSLVVSFVYPLRALRVSLAPRGFLEKQSDFKLVHFG